MRSMTGYGTAEGPVGKGRLFVEVKSVNHRFCDINLKLPPKMGILDPYIRRYLQGIFARGKIDVFLKEKVPLFGGFTLAVDIGLARQYQRNFKKLARELDLPQDVDFLSCVGIERFIHLEEREGSYEKMWRQIEGLLKKAANNVRRMQEREGSNLLKDQNRSLQELSRLVVRMHRETGRIFTQHEARVRKRVSGNADAVAADTQRLQLEVAYLSSRQDVAEELTRLESHIDQYGGLLKLRGPIGRKLDFLLQEMNREVNTIGAKAADATVSRMVVDSKALLERLREQIQNVE